MANNKSFTVGSVIVSGRPGPVRLSGFVNSQQYVNALQDFYDQSFEIPVLYVIVQRDTSNVWALADVVSNTKTTDRTWRLLSSVVSDHYPFLFNDRQTALRYIDTHLTPNCSAKTFPDLPALFDFYSSVD